MTRLYLFLALCICNAFSFDASYLRNDKKTKAFDKVDLVIFSYDRPLQLYALLESCERYLKGLHSVRVVLRTSDKTISKAYGHVFRHFPYVNVHRQNKKYLARSFKNRVHNAIFGKKSKARYFMFAVDDMMVTDYVN